MENNVCIHVLAKTTAGLETNVCMHALAKTMAGQPMAGF